MQVFVPYSSPIDVAKCLDKRRLHKQILEGKQIIKTIRGGSSSWKNHPVVKMYENYLPWLSYYVSTLYCYHAGLIETASDYSYIADSKVVRPPFLTDEFCNQHKKRLYTKSPKDYPQFAKFGKSDENWYVVDGKLLKYRNGKKI